MTISTPKPPSLMPWLFCVALNLFPILVQGAEEKPVSWVNPKLPAGPGLSHHILDSKAMGHAVGYVVWTPEGYDASGKTKYPVIYFLHGMGGNESADAGGFSSRLAKGIRDGHMSPVICVFPNGGRSGYRGDVERMIVEELVPLIDRNYPTRAETKSRAVAGFSMGGAGAVRLSLLHPDLFCAAGSWGGGMGRGGDELLAAVEKNSETLRRDGYAALLINGDQDRPEAYKSLAERLAQLDLEHQVVVLPNTPHNLGLYYERAGDTMIKFLGRRLAK